VAIETGQRLLAITSSNKFEQLATSVLRLQNDNYRTIIHTGINEKGETKPSPLDGFCLIPNSSPPHFILVEHTINDSNLERKWLHDHTKVKSKRKKKKPGPEADGDVLKAGRRASEIRKDFPNAVFTLVLCTNQVVNENLLSKVYQQASRLGMNIDILEFSRLTDFLDHNSDGQYLRKQFLGIEVERVSHSLLKDLSQKSIEEYQANTYLTDKQHELIERPIADSLMEEILYSSQTTHFLEGESGHGKSTLVLAMLKKYVDSGGAVLWLPGEVLEKATNVLEALNLTLHVLQPTLEINPVEAIFGLTGLAQPLFVAVDDINKSHSATQQLRKLLAFGIGTTKRDSNEQSSPQTPPIKIVCPVWPANLQEFKSKEQTAGAMIHEVPNYNLAEAIQAVQLRAKAVHNQIDQGNAETLAHSLGYDPIFIALWDGIQTNAVYDNIIEQYINGCFDETSKNNNFLRADYAKAFKQLASRLLDNYTFSPNWEAVLDWFKKDTETLTILRQIIQDGRLCKLNDISGQQHLIFRHDRMRDWALVKCFKNIIEQNPKNSILSEPHYANLIGRAILETDHTNIDWLKQNAPIVLVEALREASLRGKACQPIQEAVIEWAKTRVKTGEELDSVIWAASLILAETDNESVLEITEKFPDNQILSYARLRNGDVASCILEFTRYYNRFEIFEPALNHEYRDGILRVARQHHGAKIIQQVKQILNDTNAEQRYLYGGLILAGFFGDADLSRDIAVAWKTLTMNGSFEVIHLLATLWATLRCWNQDSLNLLDSLLAKWSSVPHHEKPSLHPPTLDKNGIGKELAFSLNHHPISSNVLQHLLLKAEQHNDLAHSMLMICEWLLTPLAVEHLARPDNDWFVSQIGHNWDPYDLGYLTMPEDSKKALQRLWHDSESIELRKSAFYMWVDATTKRDLSTLQTVPIDLPWYESVVQRRVKLGDYSVVPSLLELLRNDNNYWLLQDAYNIWNNDLKEYVRQKLLSVKGIHKGEFTDKSFNLVSVLTRNVLTQIPIQDANDLIVDSWESIKYISAFLSAALSVNTPDCVKLVSETIKLYPNEVKLFDFFSSYLGHKTMHRRHKTTIKHLYSFEPYLDLFDKYTLSDLLDIAKELKQFEWIEKHLVSRIEETSPRYGYPGFSEVVADFDESLKRHPEHKLSFFWAEKFKEDFDDRFEIRDILIEWLKQNQTKYGLETVAECLIASGNRKDLSLLTMFDITISEQKKSRIIRNTTFAVCRRTL
jgi:hypothetical protein